MIVSTFRQCHTPVASGYRKRKGPGPAPAGRPGPSHDHYRLRTSGHGNVAQRDRLGFLVGRREAILLEEQRAGVLTHVREQHEVGVIVFQAREHIGNGFCDGWRVLGFGAE